jgi:DNA-directed RNA polymerase subunit H (RpoH/RPB5)
MDATETLDLIVRSRPTILEILNDRGYDVDIHMGVGPEEVFLIAARTPELLKIVAPKKTDGNAPMERAIVYYFVTNPIRQRAEAEIQRLWDHESNSDTLDPTKDEVILILAEPAHDIFHIQASKQWSEHKRRVNFFQLKNIISNPAKHVFVPPHRKLSPEEVSELLSTGHLVSKSQLPHIKYHVDMQTRVHGLVPGDVVEITRASETSGVATVYRICSLAY